MACEPDHDSVESTPRADHHNHEDAAGAAFQPRLRFMCSFGGKILPRPHDNQLRYVGGDTRIVAVNRHTSFSLLLSKLAKLSGTTDISIKYQLPNEDLDALITVTGDEDVENMMEEYDRAAVSHKSARLRLFLFPTESSEARGSNIDSLLDGSAKRENWFVDALNRGGATPSVLERGRSEVSSIVSEVPDYLFGFDNPDDASKESNHTIKSKSVANDNVSASDPGSPAPAISSPFCSTSTSLPPPGLPVIPDLPPVKTRQENPVPLEYTRESVEKPISQSTAFSGAPIYHYQSQAVQSIPAMYYLPAGNVPVPPLPVQPQFVQSFPVIQGQLPVGFPGPVYGAGVRQPDFPAGYVTDNSVYYGARNMALVPGSYASMAIQGGDEVPISGADSFPGRISQGS